VSENNGWPEYKALLLDDRRRNEEKFEKVFGKLDDIAIQLTELKTQRNGLGWLSNMTVTSIISLIVGGATAAITVAMTR